jgi:hypothetical protein
MRQASASDCSGKISGLLATDMKMTVFRDVTQCSLVDVDRSFRRAYCRNHQYDKLISETVRFYETSVNMYQTIWCYTPEDNHLHKDPHCAVFYVLLTSIHSSVLSHM